MKLGESKVWVQGIYSLAVVIPRLVVHNYGIKPGDTVEFVAEGNKLVLVIRRNE